MYYRWREHNIRIIRRLTRLVEDVYPKIFESIATGSNSGSERFVLFGSKRNVISGVRYFLVLRYLTSLDPYEDVDTFDITKALEKSGKLVDARGIPSIADFFILMVDEIFVRCHSR